MGALGVSQFVDLLVGGLAVGCVYSLVALGFAMIMRATSIIHFAQGELMMLGAMMWHPTVLTNVGRHARGLAHDLSRDLNPRPYE